MNKKRAMLLAAGLMALVPLWSCKSEGKPKKVKLRSAVAVKSTEEGRAKNSIQIAIGSVISPQSSFLLYSEMGEYIGKKLGTPPQVVFKKTYAETNNSLKNAESDIAFICTGAYLAALSAFPVDLLAVPVVNGKSVYYSYLIVRKSDSAHTFGDLQGKVFAYNDELSLSGYLYMKRKVLDYGSAFPGFFSGTVLTGSHDNSIKAVAEGYADIAAIDSLVYDFLLRQKDRYVKQVRILERSPAFGIPPVVARTGLGADVKNNMRAILLDMHRDESGSRILKGLSIDRFVAPPPGLYSYAETLWRQVR